MPTDLFSSSSTGLIGIYDEAWPRIWYQADSIPPAPNKWHKVAFDISPDTTTETNIFAFLLENMSVNKGTFYLDNIRTVVDFPLLLPHKHHQPT